MNVQSVLPPDAIPSIDDPAFGDDYFGDSDDRVVVVDGDPPRAYPVAVLDYHEICNDVVDGRPVAVTWCPLCRSTVAYDRRVDGRTLAFGVSGKLADDDLVMYDRQTDSEWKQSSGECIAGAFEGAKLSMVAAPVVTAGRFREDHPDGVFLQPPTADRIAGDDPPPDPEEYGGEPYRDYFETEGFGLAARRGSGSREWNREDLDPKAIVLGVESGDEALGFPLGRVEAAGGVVEAAVGGERIVAFAGPDGVHAFEHPGFDLAPADDAGQFRGDGTTWDGATGEAADGRSLRRVAARRLFAFAWQDDHGPDSFWSPGDA